jgi:hypothetical protein
MGSGYVRDRHSRPIALLAEPHFLLSGEPPAPLDAGYNLDPFLRHSHIHRRTPMPYKLCHVSGRKWGHSNVDVERLIGDDAFESTILVLERLHLGNIADFHAAKFRLPGGERRRADAVVATKIFVAMPASRS